MARRPDAADRNERFARHLAEVNNAGTRIAAALVAVLVSVMWFLDQVVITIDYPHDAFVLLQSLRLLTVSVAICALVLSFTRYGPKYVSALSITLCAVTVLGMAAFLYFQGGYDSPFYVGLILVMLGTGVLMKWRLWECIVVYGVVDVSYNVTCLLQVPDASLLDTAVANNFFLLGTIAIVTVAQMNNLRLFRREFMSSDALATANVSLRQLDRLKTQFFTNITHELRTPLSLMLVPLDLVLAGELGPLSQEQRVQLRAMRRSGLKLMKLIRDLLELARIDEAQTKLRLEDVELTSYLERIIDEVKPLAERKYLTLSLEAESGPLMMPLDREKMDRVMINLLANAAKFTDPGGRITVRLRDAGERIELEVADTGIGIPEDRLDAIFERFQQVADSTLRRGPGSGIGLALAKEYVELHGGTIHAESAPGQGTVMHIELRKGTAHLPAQRIAPPDAATPDDQPVEGAPAAEQVHLGDMRESRLMDIDEATSQVTLPETQVRAVRVLVVEDNPEMAALLSRVLGDRFTVDVAADGVEGWLHIQAQRPEAVVTDLMMPKMDGLELTRRIKGEPQTAHIPVVMLTSKGDVEDRIVGLEHGADAYLGKPFEVRELLTVLGSLLKQQDRQAEQVLRGSIDSLDTVFAGVAHKINNALNYIKNGAAILDSNHQRQSELLPAALGALGIESRQELEQLHGQADSMFEVIGSGIANIQEMIALLKRYARDGFDRELQVFDVHQAIRDVLQMVQAGCTRQVEVVTQLDGDGQLWCVPDELHQALTNLVQNAFDVVPEPGRVEVRATEEDGRFTLRVRDNGPGVPDADRRRIFTPFFTTKEGSGGMGLGLAITYRVVQTLGGEIAVNDVAGGGAEFVIHLPSQPPAPQGAQ